MFRLFETLIHPYPDGEPRPLPRNFAGFVWACTAGLRGYIVLLACASAAFSIYEAWLFSVLGQVVDWLTRVQPGQLWELQRPAVLLFTAVLVASTLVVAFQTVVKHQTLAINFPLRLR
ncbi:MAG: multidrug ABC transporter ATP-binding protein, partial [Comamonadaceae bacterium]